MLQQIEVRSAQRTVIGLTRAGQPRTYRLVRPRTRFARLASVLRFGRSKP